jgi:hypothetical protein
MANRPIAWTNLVDIEGDLPVRNNETFLVYLVLEHVIQMFFENDLSFRFQAVIKDFG